MPSSSEDDEPLHRRSGRATARKIVSYASSDNEGEEEEVVVPVKKKGAAKVVSQTPESSSAAEDEDDVPQGMVVKSKQTKFRNNKEQLVAELLCRWWYVLPEWPPRNHDYASELNRRGLVLVDLDEWEETQDVDVKTNKLKCYALSQFPGVFRDAKGELIDCRPKEGKPSYNNMMTKSDKELATLLVKAYEKQIEQLGSTDDDLAKELRARLNKVKSLAK